MVVGDFCHHGCARGAGVVCWEEEVFVDQRINQRRFTNSVGADKPDEGFGEYGEGFDFGDFGGPGIV